MQVLELVYKNTDQIDSNLVTSIIVPAEDPDAADVFFRINNMVRRWQWLVLHGRCTTGMMRCAAAGHLANLLSWKLPLTPS